MLHSRIKRYILISDALQKFEEKPEIVTILYIKFCACSILILVKFILIELQELSFEFLSEVKILDVCLLFSLNDSCLQFSFEYPLDLLEICFDLNC